MTIRWGSYKVKGIYDELIRAAGKPRDAARPLCDYLRALKDKEIDEYKSAADLAIHVMGITFTVYSEDVAGTEGELHFEIEIKDVRKATEEEINAGRALKR